MAETQQPKVTEPTPEETKETLLESLSGTAMMIVCWLFIVTFIAQNFEIPSPSMVNTMLVGDHLIVDHSTFAPPSKWMPLNHYRDVQHGDIIVFLKPNPEQPDFILVKRAIGLPGDHLRLDHGVLFRNGQKVNEPYVSSMPDDNDADYNRHYIPYRDDFPKYGADQGEGLTAVWSNELASHVQNGELIVPPGKVFAMGDNRLFSLDSRFWGFVPRENILGRPLFVYWSFMTPDDQEYKTTASDRVAFFYRVVTHFISQTRWSRTLHRVQ